MNPSPSMEPTEVTRLALRWLDGMATDAERQTLFAVIAADPEAAQRFAKLARFEHLLAGVCHDRAQQALVVVATERQQVKHQRRQQVWTGLKAAAVLLFLGPLIWLAWPEQQVTKVANANPKPMRSPQRIRVPSTPKLPLIEKPEVAPPSPTPPVLSQPSLEDRLLAFYLPPMRFSDVTLADALRQIETKLRAINRNADSDLSRLLVQVPAAAVQQRITFDSPGMAVLPLVRSIAGLAGCEVQLSPTTGHLVLNLSNSQTQREIRSYAFTTTPEDLEKAYQVARDAQAVGIDTSTWEHREDGQLVPPAHLFATAGQLRALDAIAASRAHLGQLAPVRVRALVVPRLPGTDNRELTPKELEEYVARSESSLDSTFTVQPGQETVISAPVAPINLQAPNPIFLQPQRITVAMDTPQIVMATPTAEPTDRTLALNAVPIGNGMSMTINTSTAATSVVSAGRIKQGFDTALLANDVAAGAVVHLNGSTSLVVVPVP